MNNTILDITQIQQIIPQRFPFLMIDRVTELSESKVVAIKNLSANEKFFVGHFPENKASLERSRKVMPGVLLIEAIAQTALILLNYVNNTIRDNSRQEISGHSRIYYLGTVKAKFFHPATVGDILKIEVKPLKVLSNAAIMEGEIFVNSIKIAQAEIGIGAR